MSRVCGVVRVTQGCSSWARAGGFLGYCMLCLMVLAGCPRQTPRVHVAFTEKSLIAGRIEVSRSREKRLEQTLTRMAEAASRRMI